MEEGLATIYSIGCTKDGKAIQIATVRDRRWDRRSCVTQQLGSLETYTQYQRKGSATTHAYTLFALIFTFIFPFTWCTKACFVEAFRKRSSQGIARGEACQALIFNIKLRRTEGVVFIIVVIVRTWQRKRGQQTKHDQPVSRSLPYLWNTGGRSGQCSLNDTIL